jgi:hypothetical protein
MAGQSAHLSLSEARAMQNRVQHSGSQAKSSGSSKSLGESMRKKSPKKMKEISKEDC